MIEELEYETALIPLQSAIEKREQKELEKALSDIAVLKDGSHCRDKFDAFVALGCVIKGKTPHFDFICRSAFDAIMNLSIKYNKPIGNGIITALNKKQAYERCGKIKSSKNNKGREAAKAVLSILNNGTKKI